MTKKYLILFFFLTGCGLKEHISAVNLNNEGVGLLESDSPTGAQQNFVDALARLPFEAKIHSNLGVSFDQAKEIDKAIASYSSANENSKNDVDRFLTAFNLGQAYAKKGNVAVALDWYQKALTVLPTSKEVKTNIELLNQGGGNKGDNQQKNDKKESGQEDKDNKDNKDKKKDPNQYANQPKPKPREFKGELSEKDVKKILGELKQQEQRIRADYNRKEEKEMPHGKDW